VEAVRLTQAPIRTMHLGGGGPCAFTKPNLSLRLVRLLPSSSTT
jgi:hypothetical protein